MAWEEELETSINAQTMERLHRDVSDYRKRKMHATIPRAAFLQSAVSARAANESEGTPELEETPDTPSPTPPPPISTVLPLPPLPLVQQGVFPVLIGVVLAAFLMGVVLAREENPYRGSASGISSSTRRQIDHLVAYDH